jgi:hypothetical protein
LNFIIVIVLVLNTSIMFWLFCLPKVKAVYAILNCFSHKNGSKKTEN